MDQAVLDVAAEVEKSKGRAPKPPETETRARLERTRALLEEGSLDAILAFGSSGTSPEPVRYLAGYVHVFPTASSFVLIPRDGDPILMIDQPWHLDEAAEMSWIEDVRTFPNGARRWLADELRTSLKDALGDSGLTSGTVGVLEAAMPTVYLQALRDAAPGLEIVDGSWVWDDLVGSPSDYDREMVHRTAQIADRGLATVVDAARAGVPEYEVCLEALRAMAALGAEFVHGSGVSTHINIGSHSLLVSNVRPFLFTGNQLEEGQMFWVDLTASYAGYYIDCDRTIAVGEPTERQRELYDVTAAMYAAMLESARAGVPGGELWDAGDAVARDAGLAEYSNHVYLGHTTGASTSQRPVIARGEAGPLREGSFVNVEPGIFVPGVGSACIENTLAVEADGATAVNAFDIGLHVV
jgi:Xaa-Pro aminopeptidase